MPKTYKFMAKSEGEFIDLSHLSTNELLSIFEDYSIVCDLDDVESIFIDAAQDLKVRYAAYLYLVAKAPLSTIVRLATHMDFSYRDSSGCSAVLVAVKSGNRENLTWLLHNTDITLAGTDASGRCPIRLAIMHDQLEMLMLLTKSVKKGGCGLSIKITDPRGNDAVLIAAAQGRLTILKKLVTAKHKGGFGLSLNSKNKYGSDLVLVAAANGQIAVLQSLITKKKEGGFGLSLDVKNHNGNDAVLSAAACGEIAMLDFLVKPISNGGCGLSLDTKNYKGIDVVGIVIEKDECEMLQHLLSSKEKGGCGLIVTDIMHALQKAHESKSSRVYQLLFMKEMNELLDKCDVEKAIQFANKMVCLHGKSHFDIHDAILVLYRRVLVDILSKSNSSKSDFLAAEALVEAIENLSKGEGRFLLGKAYLENAEFDEAFKLYQSIFNDRNTTASQRGVAGFELASMIFNGYVVISEKGMLVDAAQLNDMQRKKEGMNALVMARRAIAAYEYLTNDTTIESRLLLNRLRAILAGHLTGELVGAVNWQKEYVHQFYQYYRYKNLSVFDDQCVKEQLKLQQIKIPAPTHSKSASVPRQSSKTTSIVSGGGLFSGAKSELPSVKRSSECLSSSGFVLR